MVSCINLNASIPRKQIFLLYLTNLLEFYSTWYERVIILGDFNIEATNKAMKDFLQEQTFNNMMKHSICLKFTNYKLKIFIYGNKFI